MAKLITESSLGISVPPADVRLITGPQDPYKWVSLPEKRYLFEKHLSKHCTRAYREICVGVGEAFEAVPTDASNNETPEARPEKTSELEVTKKPASSFTAKINELERQNLALMTELEQWRSTASNAEALNRELGASLEAAQLSVNALQQEKERMKESCRQNAMAANFFRIKAVQADATIKELFSAFESVKAKIPAVCPDSESLQARSHYKG
jgi:predicted RNase H-like nuclease (RuvC/YqgF family)